MKREGKREKGRRGNKGKGKGKRREGLIFFPWERGREMFGFLLGKENQVGKKGREGKREKGRLDFVP